jgi:hypothetical protein
MKYLFTKTNLIASILGIFSCVNQAEAQICGATNSTGCSLDWFSAVSFKNSGGTAYSVSGLNCGNTGTSNKLMTNGAVMDITPGEDISMTIENTCSYDSSVTQHSPNQRFLK